MADYERSIERLQEELKRSQELVQSKTNESGSIKKELGEYLLINMLISNAILSSFAFLFNLTFDCFAFRRAAQSESEDGEQFGEAQDGIRKNADGTD